MSARVRLRAEGERGSGTVLAFSAVGVIVAIAVGAVLVCGAWEARQRAAHAADAAALAGAEVAVGRSPGEPCAEAERVAQANGAALGDCTVAGVVVQVTAVVPYAGWQARVPARAGPPGAG